MKNLLNCILCLCVATSITAQAKRNLLAGKFNVNDLKTALAYDSSWAPYPSYYDRAKWDNIAPAYKAQLIAKGEEALKYKWQVVPAMAYIEYTRSGNRAVMQDVYGQNVGALQSLVLAELAEGKGRFMDQMVNGVWTLCEMTTWALSAHLPAQKAGAGLPDVSDPIIDLGVGNTSLLMAWTHYYFKREFDKINPLIAKRISYEINRQVLQPYYTRDDFWWMAFKNDSFVNNWNVWVNYNVLNCILLIETDPQKKLDGVYKTMRSVDKFINYYKDDGACEEGPAYWSEAGAMMYLYLDILQRATKGKVDQFNEPIVKNIGAYIYKAYINKDYYINFADASARLRPEGGLIYNYGKAVKDTMMMGFGSMLAQQQGWKDRLPNASIDIAVADIFDAKEILEYPSRAPFIGDFFMEGTQIMAAREFPGTVNGFYLAAKAGHNAESHNHNDVGTCIVFYNGNPLLIDIGSETYTRQTFSKERYTRWAMRSAYHNVPLINNVEQHEGAAYKASSVNFKSTKTAVSFSADIAATYPADAGVKKWVRGYELQRGKGLVIKDTYELLKNEGTSELHYMTCDKVEKVKDGVLQFTLPDGMVDMIYDAAAVTPVIEAITITDNRLLNSWPKEIYRIILKLNNKSLSGSNTLTLQTHSFKR